MESIKNFGNVLENNSIYSILSLKKEIIMQSPMKEELQQEMKKKDLIVLLLEIKKFQKIK